MTFRWLKSQIDKYHQASQLRHVSEKINLLTTSPNFFLPNLCPVTFVIASDALSLERNLDKEEVPKNAWNPQLIFKSYEELKKIKKSGYIIVCGHDDNQWKNNLDMGVIYN